MATSGTSPGAPRRFAAASLWVGIALIAISIYFFLASVTLISPPTQAVVAALLSAIIGFVMLSAGTTLVRTYVVARVVEQNPK
ncbi:MAG: hypothetical protein OK442_02150 [Thaumarchaeota archaeon]|nr:hypothetical protein [Nitrososphaerota archaeon]